MERCRMESQRAINVRISLTLPTTTHNLELVILDVFMQTYPTVVSVCLSMYGFHLLSSSCT